MTYLPAGSIQDEATMPVTLEAMSVDLIRASKQIVPAVSATARDQVAAAWPAATGAAISASNPIYVHRTDTDVIEMSVDGSTWSILRPNTDTGWVDESRTEAGWTINEQQTLIRDGIAWAVIDWTRTGGNFTGTNLTLRLASGNGPGRTLYPFDLVNTTTKVTYIAQCNTDGAVIGIAVAMVTGERLRGLVKWPVG